MSGPLTYPTARERETIRQDCELQLMREFPNADSDSLYHMSIFKALKVIESDLFLEEQLNNSLQELENRIRDAHFFCGITWPDIVRGIPQS